MNEDFITKGIENDRYLKAVRLYKQFEEEIVRELRDRSEEIMERDPELFDGSSPSKSISRRRTSPLGHMRMDNEMSRVNHTGDQLTLNIGIEWAKPELHGHEDPSDGALCIVYYKIKRLDLTDFERVKRQTESASRWDGIQFDDDLWNSDWRIFYIPVTSGSEIKAGLETLKEHFLEFGDQFGEEHQAD